MEGWEEYVWLTLVRPRASSHIVYTAAPRDRRLQPIVKRISERLHTVSLDTMLLTTRRIRMDVLRGIRKNKYKPRRGDVCSTTLHSPLSTS